MSAFDGLAPFILKRLAEEEAAARTALQPGVCCWQYEQAGGHDRLAEHIHDLHDSDSGVIAFFGAPGYAEHIALNHPAAALRDIAGKRELVKRCARLAGEPDAYPNGLVSSRAVLARHVLMHLGTRWEDHQDHRFIWLP